MLHCGKDVIVNPRWKDPAKSPTLPIGERPQSADVQAQLERLLESPPFRTSKRCSAFLRYVVEGACQGKAEFLKERTLGISVFDRDPDYDTNQDPVVRNTAGEVRKRLAQYYCEPGRELELRIDLPTGAYVPEIYAPAIAVAEPRLKEEDRRPARNWRWAGIGAAGVIGTALLAIALFRSRPSEVDQFWAPVLNRPGAVVLCVGQGHTYKLKGDLDRVFEDAAGAAPPGNLPFSDLTPMWDRYISINDAQTLTRLVALFTRFGKETTLRGGRATTLADLRGKPSVLIGAFNNEWTLSLTGELRFYFDQDAEHKTDVVRDRQNPGDRSWRVRTDLPDNQIPMDYAIISRVFNATTEQPVVVAAGIKGAGTYAAGEFLTKRSYLADALQKAPRDWAHKNVQFVLATRLFSGNPGPPQVVAAYFW
jgi:hypothetical protein